MANSQEERFSKTSKIRQAAFSRRRWHDLDLPPASRNFLSHIKQSREWHKRYHGQKPSRRPRMIQKLHFYEREDARFPVLKIFPRDIIGVY
jgi:hypothetical protein